MSFMKLHSGVFIHKNKHSYIHIQKEAPKIGNFLQTRRCPRNYSIKYLSVKLIRNFLVQNPLITFIGPFITYINIILQTSNLLNNYLLILYTIFSYFPRIHKNLAQYRFINYSVIRLKSRHSHLPYSMTIILIKCQLTIFYIQQL